MTAAERIDQAVACTLPLYSSKEDPSPARLISLAELAALASAPTLGPKLEAAAVTPYSATGKKKEHALQSSYHLLVIDHDHDNQDAAGIERIYDSFGVSFLAYTTSTHQRPDKQSGAIANRWRVLVPLAAPIDAAQYHRLACGIAYALGADMAQARVNQVFFAPNREADDQPYQHLDRLSRPHLDTDDYNHPLIDKALAGWQSLQRAKEAQAQAAVVKARPVLSADKVGIIDKALAAYSLRDLLEANGYKRQGADYLSPTSSSGNAGVHILERDGKEVCYSHHGDSDPLSAMNNNGHALDAFDVLVALEYRGDFTLAIRTEAKKLDQEGQKQRQREHMQERERVALQETVSPLAVSVSRAGGGEPEPFDLAQFSLAGKSAAMKAKMMADKYVLGSIAILGQATAIYAKPNSGKTLLTVHLLIESIKSGEINGADVFYVNADDTYKGLVQKLELAERYGFHMLAPGHSGFDANLLLRYLQKMIDDDAARGKVLILDTLKKFTDIMDKRISSDFGKVMRSFVSHGGTLIMLAHTNKNRDTNGKVVFSGTSDIVDDVDCAYTLDATETGGDSKTVLFENFKQRGDVAREVAYTYSTREKQSYAELLASVCELDEEKKKAHQEQARVAMTLVRNADAIEAITEAIQSGVSLKTELIEAASKASGISKQKISKALEAHTGEAWQSGHRWRQVRLEHNAKQYHLLTVWMPKPVNDYQAAKDGD
ncbi:MAG: helicase RepA family protein [Nitrospira sp.]|nr:helicase RepA family protein [Nitrospira sp.]